MGNITLSRKHFLNVNFFGIVISEGERETIKKFFKNKKTVDIPLGYAVLNRSTDGFSI